MDADGLTDGETLGEMLGLIDGDMLADGEIEALPLTATLGDTLGDTDGLSDRLTLADGLTDCDTDGLTDALGLIDADPASGPVSVVNEPPKVRSRPLPESSPVSVLSAKGQSAHKPDVLTAVVLSRSARSSLSVSATPVQTRT